MFRSDDSGLGVDDELGCIGQPLRKFRSLGKVQETVKAIMPLVRPRLEILRLKPVRPSEA